MLTILVAGVAVGLAEGALLLGLRGAGVLHSDLGSRLLMLTLLFHALGLVVAMVHQRRTADDVGFPRLLATGMLVTFFAAIISAAVYGVFLTWIDPAYLDWTLDAARQQLETMELSAEEEQAARAGLENATAFVYATRSAIGYLVRGFFLSLMLAAVLRMRVLKSGDEA